MTCVNNLNTILKMDSSPALTWENAVVLFSSQPTEADVWGTSKGTTMAKNVAKMTKAELIELVAELAKQVEKKQTTQRTELVKPCPDYATAAQRAEYEKLAKRAKQLYKEVCRAAGTEAVSVFIPVSKDNVSRMPHTITFKATYSK